MSLRTHKILGYCLGILFLMWFLSGIVMLFCRYPRVSGEQLIEHGHDLRSDFELPKEVFSNDGKNTLSLSDNGAGTVLNVSGHSALLNGKEVDTHLIASRWGRNIVSTDTLYSMDVWLLGRMPKAADYPILKYTYANGNELYVSQATSEPIQFTTQSQRTGAWLGAVPHWLYITPLRSLGRDPWAWVIIVLSLAGVLMVVLGLVAGIAIAIKSKRRTGKISPYSAPLARWHHTAGCIFGIFVLGWIFSGYMSMVSIPKWMVPTPDSARIPRFENVSIDKFTYNCDSVLAHFDNARKLTWLEIAGDPVYKVIESDGEVHLINASGCHAGETYVIDEDLCHRIGGNCSNVELLHSYDSQYISLRNELPLPVYRICVPDNHGLTIYINPKDASMRMASANGAVRTFLYRGLHCLSFPMMTHVPHLRIAVMLVFLLLGLIITVTGLLQVKSK